MQSDSTANTTSGKTKTYVVTADGKWYYWNGTAWTPGGTYQSTGIADGSVTLSKVSFATPKTVSTNIFNPSTITDGYYLKNTDGKTQSTLTDYAYSDYMSVIPNEILQFCDSTPSSYIMWYDGNFNFVSTLNGAGTAPGVPKPLTVTVPSNAYYMRVNIDKRVVPVASYTIMGNRVGSSFSMDGLILKSYNIPNQIVTPIQTTFVSPNDVLTNIFNPSTAVEGSYIGTNGVSITTSSLYAHSDYESVIAGESLTINDATPTVFAMFYDASKTFISTINGYGTAPGSPQPMTITVPTNASFMRVNYDLRVVTTNTFSVNAIRGGTKLQINDLVLKGGNIPNGIISKDMVTPDFFSGISSPWKGKTWLAIGDSITDATTSYIKYVENIKNTINCTVNNQGFSGSGYMNYLPIYNRISSLPDAVDLITVFAGTNDYNGVNSGMALGSFGDTTSASFYGCVDLAFQNLITKYPTKTIAVFTPLPRSEGETPNAAGFKVSDYANAIKKVANKYSLPVLDLYNESNFFATNATFRSTYSSDGLHPNTEWHKILARKVLAFLNTL